MIDIKNLRNRQNLSFDGFDFDMDTFENLVESFTPMDDILVILSTDRLAMDKFCMLAYHMDFPRTYDTLLKLSLSTQRKAIVKLAGMGNQTALKIMAENFMKLNASNQQEFKIQVVSDLPKSDDGNGSNL